MKRSKLWDIQNHVPERIMQKYNPWTKCSEIKKMYTHCDELSFYRFFFGYQWQIDHFFSSDKKDLDLIHMWLNQIVTSTKEGIHFPLKYYLGQ